MKHLIYLLLVILTSELNIFSLQAQYKLVELNPGFNYGIWYKGITGYAPDRQWFGAWVIAPHNDSLYFGFATNRPFQADGALLAKWDGISSMLPLGQFDEQGVHYMMWFRDTLYTIGSDPSKGDGWDGGNFYKYFSSGQLVKIRYNAKNKPVLPNVLHSCGLFIDTLNNRFYQGTGSYDPVQYARNNNNCTWLADTVSCFGQIWQSDDCGNSWQLISRQKPFQINPFRAINRAWDVCKSNNVLYEINDYMWMDSTMRMYDTTTINKSFDNSQTWIEIEGINPKVAKMCIFKNKLVIAAKLTNNIYSIDSITQVAKFSIPGMFGSNIYNAFANVENRYLITYLSNGSVQATTNLTNWVELIPATGKNFISIAYWEKEKTIVLAQRDSIGKIWKLDISDLLTTGVKELSNPTVKNFYLGQNYPNPFYDKTVIPFTLSVKSEVSITLYDIYGREAAILLNKEMDSGDHQIIFNADDLPAGIYLCRLGSGKYSQTKKILISK